MLTIREDQARALVAELKRRRRDSAAAEIRSLLMNKAPKLMNRYTPGQCLQCIREVIDATEKVGVNNPHYIVNWAYIRLLTNLPFYEMPEFRDVLDHPFLHADAKGRHIVLSFFAINRMHTGEVH